MSEFTDTLKQAIADILGHGYDSPDRVTRWLEQLRKTAQASLVPQSELQHRLTSALDKLFRRYVGGPAYRRRHQGLSAFTLKQIEPKLRLELDRRILASAELIKLNREASIRRTLHRFEGWATSIPKGGTRAETQTEVAPALKKAFASLPFEERRVVVDQGHKLLSAVNAITAEAGEALAAVWHSHWRESGYDFRPRHKQFDGRVFALRNNWAMREGLMKTGGHFYTDQIEQPAQEPFCFPGDSKIPFARGVEIAYRRWYRGELTTIVTVTGKTLQMTPNHPVLTPLGWIACKFLKEGDDVIEIPEEDLASIKRLEANDNDRISTIAQIYGAINEVGVSRGISGSSEQFHGDGLEGNVDIVRTARFLSFGFVAELLESGKQCGFAKALLRGSPRRAFKLFLDGCLGACAGFVRSFSELLTSAFTYTFHAQYVGLGTTTQTNTKARRERAPRYTETFGNGKQAFPIPIRRTRIVKIESRGWAGHVYNLQTADGWYSAEGVIVHNCRCYYTYIYGIADLPDDMVTAKGKMAIQQKEQRRAAS